MQIRTPDHRLRVFVSSTLKELADERIAVRQAIQKLHLAPVMFESGARPHPPKELYKSYLLQSQVFVGIYWQSYGWTAPGMNVSGLEDEYSMSSGMPSLIYIKKPAPEREPALTRLLDRIRDENAGSYVYFSSVSELGELVENDLALLLSERFENSVGQVSPSGGAMKLPRSNLPIPRNPLVDRELEQQSAQQLLLKDDVALLTLTGAGGTGKSRLAIEVALSLQEHFDDGVFLVALEPITDPARVIPAISEHMGVREAAGGRPVTEMLKEFLREKQMLLLLDNFEQVLSAALAIADLLETCPHLKLLVTSRTPLHLRAERVLPIPPLLVPPRELVEDTQGLTQYAAVQLFVQRAQANKPDFAVTDENATSVVEIVTRLDGLPLAIELAAARTRLLSPDELRKRLTNRLELLRGGTRDLPERQQTLRGTIDWSYRLIDEAGRKLLRRLAVFADGWTLEAGSRVCDSDGVLSTEFEDAMASLIDSSLALLLPSRTIQQSRFGMLGTIHEFATEQLTESGEAGELHCRHAQYYLDFIRAVEPRVRSAERSLWQPVLEQEFLNIRAALEWVCSTKTYIPIGQQIAIEFGFAWHFCGHIAEGEDWCLRLLDLSSEATPLPVRAGLLTWAGELAWARGNHLSAVARLDEALAILQDADDKQMLARAMCVRGICALSARDLKLAREMFENSIQLFQETHDIWYEAVAVSWLGDQAGYEDDREQARVLHDRAIALAREQGDPWCLVPPLMSTGQQAVMDGDLETARAVFLEAEGVLRQTDDNWSLCWALNDLGFIALMLHELEQAEAYFLEALTLARLLGNQRSVLISLAGTGAVLASKPFAPPGGEREIKADPGLAACLCGATATAAKEAGVFLWPDTQKLYEDAIKKAQSSIEATQWERAYSEGEKLGIDQAVDMAIRALRR